MPAPQHPLIAVFVQVTQMQLLRLNTNGVLMTVRLEFLEPLLGAGVHPLHLNRRSVRQTRLRSLLISGAMLLFTPVPVRHRFVSPGKS